MAQKLTDDEKLVKIKEYKEKGNGFHKEGNYKKAAGSYHRAILYIKGLSSNSPDVMSNILPGMSGAGPQVSEEMPPDILEEARKLTCDCYNNLAACLLKEAEPNYERVIEHCDKALEASPSNGKALFRKGVALYSLGQFTEALVVLNRAPAGPEVKKYMELSKVGEKQQEKELANLYKGMFRS